MSESTSLPMTGQLLSIQVGRPREMVIQEHADERPLPWRSGIYKSRVEGTVHVTTAGVEGDGQDDLFNHGGPDNVALAYDAAHYPVWRQRLGREDLDFGSFGENFTVEGFTDETVCIGDVWRVGAELTLQVTQARQPCYKLGRRLRHLGIVKMVREAGWGGWYLRVLAPGPAEAGMSIACVERLHPEWNVARAVQVMYNRKIDRTMARELAGLAELSARWKRELVEI